MKEKEQGRGREARARRDDQPGKRERQEEAWRQGEQRGRPRKPKPEVVERCLRRYPSLKLKAAWKIMGQDGLSASYETLRRRVKGLGYVCANGAWRGLGL